MPPSTCVAAVLETRTVLRAQADPNCLPSTKDEFGLTIKDGLFSVDKVAGKVTEFAVIPGSPTVCPATCRRLTSSVPTLSNLQAANNLADAGFDVQHKIALPLPLLGMIMLIVGTR